MAGPFGATATGGLSRRDTSEDRSDWRCAGEHAGVSNTHSRCQDETTSHGLRDVVEAVCALHQPCRRWKPDAVQNLTPAVCPVMTPQRLDDVVLPDLDHPLRLRLQLADQFSHPPA